MPADELIDYLYKKNWNFGPQVSTNGFSLGFSYERNQTFKFKQGVHLLIGDLRGGNETRRTNSIYENSRSYVFGKINLLFSTRLGYSSSWLLFERKRIRGVTIRYNFILGPSCGIIKPIYLKIKEPYTQIPEPEAMDLRYKPDLHHGENIIGRSTIWKGFQESSFELGAFAKTGFQFDFSPKSEKITAVEIGIQLDYFKRKVDLFYIGNNKNIFVGFYAALQFGKNKI